jgi:hypothetical protein
MPNRVEIVVGSQDNSKLDLESLKLRLMDVGKMVETARVAVAGDKDAEIQVERLALKLAAMGRKAASPRIGLEGAAKAEVEIAAVGLALDKLGHKDAEATAVATAVGGIGDKASGSKGKLAGLGSTLSSVLGNALKGAGGLAAGALGAGLAGPFAAAGLAAGAFGAVAIPILTKVKTANDALAKAQDQYAQATTKSQRAAALKAEAAATYGLSTQQKGLMDQVEQLSDAWGGLQDEMTTVVTGVAQMGVGIASALMPAMEKLVPAGAKVIGAVLIPMEKLFNSSFFGQFIDQMTQLAGQVAPMLGQQLMRLLVVFMQMFMQAGPAAVQILNQLVPAIVDMASGLVPVVAGVTKLVAVIVSWLAKNHLLIPALIAVGAAIALASGGLTLIIPAIALVVGGLVHLWQTSQTFRNIVTGVFSVVGRAVLTFAELWLDELHIVTNIWLTAVGIIVHGAAAALGWVPGVGPALKTAVRGFDAFKDGVNNVFNAAHTKIEQWKTNLANMPKVVRLEGNITDLTAKLGAAKRQLADPHLTATRRAAIQANIAQLEAAIARARAQLAAINGTVATTYVVTQYSSGPGTGPGAGHRGGHPLATGGITGAMGGGPRGNLTLVGEHGAELVTLPPGAMVHSNPDTQRMLGQDGGAQVIRLEISGGAADLDQILMKWFKERVRVLGGGSVQVAFGRI